MGVCIKLRVNAKLVVMELPQKRTIILRNRHDNLLVTYASSF